MIAVLKPSQLLVLVREFIRAGLNLFVIGDPAIGKTAIVALGAKLEDADLVISNPSVEDPTVPAGMPWPSPDGKTVEFRPIGQVAKVLRATKKTVWDIEDLGHAPPQMQAAYMQWFLARELNGNRLPDCVSYVATSNERKQGMGVSGILEPVKSRFASIVKLVPDVDDWIDMFALQAGKEFIPPEMIAYHRFQKESSKVDGGVGALFEFVPSADIKNYPAPRTWANVGKIQTYTKMPPEIERVAIIGAVGPERGEEYLGFLRMFRALPKIERILENPDSEPVPTEPSTLYAVTAALAARANKENFAKVARYAERIREKNRGDIAALTILDATKRNPKLMQTDTFVKLMAGELGQLCGAAL